MWGDDVHSISEIWPLGQFQKQESTRAPRALRGRSLRAAPEEMQRQVLEKGVLTGRNQSMILVTTALPMRFQNVLPRILADECLL